MNDIDASKILLERYNRLGTWQAVADDIGGVSKALCWKVAMGKGNSEKLRKKLRKQPTRVRLAADVNKERKAALQLMAQDIFGMSWSELCNDLGQYLIDGGLSYAVYDYFAYPEEVQMAMNRD